MNNEIVHKIIGFLWIVVSLLIIASSIYEIVSILNSPYAAVLSGARDVTAISIGLAFISLLGGIGILFEKVWGRITALCISVFYLLYGVSFILFGGADDSTSVTSVVVLFLFLLSLSSVFMLKIRPKSV